MVYLLKYPCDEVYVQLHTTHPIKQRIGEHQSSIRHRGKNYPEAVTLIMAHIVVPPFGSGAEHINLHRGGDQSSSGSQLGYTATIIEFLLTIDSASCFMMSVV